MVAGAAAILFPLTDVGGVWAGLPLGLALFGSFIYVVPKLHASQDDGATSTWGSRLVLVGGAALLVLFVVGGLWSAAAASDPPDLLGPVFVASVLVFAAGVLLFGIASAVAATHTRLAPVLMVLGLVGSVAIDAATGALFGAEDATNWGLYLGFPVFGIGLGLMGYAARGRLAGRQPTPA